MPLRSAARFPQVGAGRPHYESFYLKATHPEGGTALWIRHTVLKAPNRPPTASVWVTLFDRDTPPRALKASYPADQLSIPAGSYIQVAGCRLGSAEATGAIDVPPHGNASWDLTFEGSAPAFPYLPRPWMYERALPRTKAISLYPSVTFSGVLELCGQRVELERWPGMIGHNWGQEHAHRGIWLQAAGFAGRPDVVLDVVAGRIKLGPLVTPWIANGCLRLGGRVHRLGGSRPSATSIAESPTGARFTIRGQDVQVEGEVSAPAERFVGWRYGEPSGGWHPTLNCSIADLRLQVRAGGGADQDLSVRGGAAYELQLRELEHGVPLQPFEDV